MFISGKVARVSESVSQNPILLTVDDVRRIKLERDEVARRYEDLGKLLAELNNKIDAATYFLPAHWQERLLEDAATTEAKGKWPPAVFAALEKAGHGLTTADLKEHFKGTPLEQDLGYQGGALFNGLAKMVAKGSIIKEDGYYRLPGQILPERPKESDRSQIQIDILQVLKENPNGLKSGQIAQAIIRDNLPAAAGMGKSTGNFYKKLSILVFTGEVIKDGPLYRLAPEKSGDEQADDDSGNLRKLRVV